MCPDDAPIADDAAAEDRRHAADPHMIADDDLPLPTDLLCGIEVLPRAHIENHMPVIRQERHAPGNGTSFADIERSPRADGKDIARHPDSTRRRRRPFTDMDSSLRSDLDILPQAVSIIYGEACASLMQTDIAMVPSSPSAIDITPHDTYIFTRLYANDTMPSYGCHDRPTCACRISACRCS